VRRAGGRAGRRGCTPTVDLQPGPGLAEPLRSLGAEVVAQQLASGRCVWVTSLWLEDNDVGVSGAKHLGHALSKARRAPRAAPLRPPARRPAAPRGGRRAARARERQNAALTQLSLAGNPIRTEGFSALLRGLASACPLESLNVRDCQIMRVPIEIAGARPTPPRARPARPARAPTPPRTQPARDAAGGARARG
jgi:hypothetical protein